MKVLLLLAAISSPAIAGPCALPTATAIPLTPNGTVIDQDGGIVVGLEQAFSGGKDEHDLAKLDWKFVEAGVATAPKSITIVAPGLAVFVPAKVDKQLALQAGRDVKASVTYQVAARRDRPIAAAPQVTGIKVTESRGPRSSSSSTDATLAAPPPAGTVAVLVYDPAAQKAGQPAKAWAHVTDPKARVVQLGHSGRCQLTIAGTQPSSASDKVVLVWMDAEGQQSLPSKEITVR